MAALCSRQQNSASAGVADRSAIADLARLAGSVPPGDSPDIAPGPAAGCADGGGFGVWLPAMVLHTAWGRIPSQPPTTRQKRMVARGAAMYKYAAWPTARRIVWANGAPRAL